MVFCASPPIKTTGPRFPLNNSLYRTAKKCLPAGDPGGKPLCEMLHDLGQLNDGDKPERGPTAWL